uniref:Uncharacterized protein n=1 Tax=Pararge aegeria TaxID=116150 RepID=S4PAT3_9NEOP
MNGKVILTFVYVQQNNMRREKMSLCVKAIKASFILLLVCIIIRRYIKAHKIGIYNLVICLPSNLLDVVTLKKTIKLQSRIRVHSHTSSFVDQSP